MIEDSAAGGGDRPGTGLACHALVVGIDAYSGGIAPLQSAVRDATAIAALLADDHHYSVTSLLDADATGQAILSFLTETLPGQLCEDSAFLLYYAGHGVARGDGSDGPQGYLLPGDARKTDEDSWLSMVDVLQALERLPCRHLLVVLDCCFAGAFRWASSRDVEMIDRPLYASQYARYLTGNAWQALTSASADERAADMMPGRQNRRDTAGSDGHSPFAAALISALSGDADSSRAGYEPDGVITAIELYQYIFERLMPDGAPSGQTPGIWPLKPANKGEFIFLNPRAPLNTRPDPPLDDANNPWLGLASYSAEQADLFCGRQRVIRALCERVLAGSAPSLQVVVGASGTGKSSVVKAGLLPLLTAPDDEQRGGTGLWACVTCARLTANPEAQLDEAERSLEAAPPGARTLLFIDQFEELYTQCADDALRSRFLGRLRALIDRPEGSTVLLTLRSDFEPRPAGDGALSDLWDAARFVVPPFSSAELREVIEAPARMKAVYFEPAVLVSTVLDEVAAMPGALPLLSFALAELYRQAQRRRQASGAADRALLAQDYDEIGGVIGAVQQQATALFSAADPAHQESIRRVFLRMVSQEGARVTRRRVHFSELEYADPAEAARVQSVVRQYVDARLLVVDGDFVEPAHDSLVVAWEKLNDWLARSGSQELTRAVWRQASDWVDKGRAVGVLWDRDPRLALLEAPAVELNGLEQEFADASVRRKTRLRRTLVGTTAAVMAVVATLAVASWVQSQYSERRETAATVRNITAAKPMIALAQAVGAMGQWFAEDVPEVRSSLLSALQYPRERTIHEREGRRPVAGVAITQNGVVAAALDPGLVRDESSEFVAVWDAAGKRQADREIGAPVAALAGCSAEAVFLVASKDGGFQILGVQDDTTPQATAEPDTYPQPPLELNSYAQLPAEVIEERPAGAASGPGARCSSGSGLVRAAAFSADCRTFAIARECATEIWSRTPGLQRLESIRETRTPRAIAIDRAGRVVARGYANGSINKATALQQDAGFVDDRYARHPSGKPVDALAVSPDGASIASADGDTVRLWRDQAGIAAQVGDGFHGHEDRVTSLAFDPADGAFVVSGSRDNSIRVWDLEGNPLSEPLRGHDSWIRAVAVSTDARTIVSGSNDGSVRRWDVARNLSELHCGEPASPLQVLAVTDDQKTSLVQAWGKAGSRLDLYAIDELCGRELVAGGRGDQFGALTPDGQFVAFADEWGKIITLRDASGDIEIPYPHDNDLRAMAISRDGAMLAAGGDDMIVRLWSRANGAWRELPREHRLPITSLAFGPEGRLVASGSEDNTVVLWDATGLGRTARPLKGHKGWISAIAFSRDGRFLVTGSWDKTVRLWDSAGNPMGNPFHGHTDWITQVGFHPQDGSVISRGYDQRIGKWQGGDSEEWMRVSCRQLSGHPGASEGEDNEIYTRARSVCSSRGF